MVKIIEGGLRGDKDKILNYATVLANNLEQQGNPALSKKIRNILSERKGQLTALDEFTSKPVDTESRLEMVEIINPSIMAEEIVLNKHIAAEIQTFIDYYTKRDQLIRAGIDTSFSILLYGPPGCGKTTVAHYIASVMGLPLVCARLDGLVSSLLGSTAKNIRKIFDFVAARDCILFLDEFDVIAKLRDDKNELGELKRVVNSLIQNIDNLGGNTIFIAATNHQKLLDPAIWRRFSKVLLLEKPNIDEITTLIKMLLYNTQNNILDNPKKLRQLSVAFDGFSYSSIKTVITNVIKNMIVHEVGFVNYGEILKEIYIYIHHTIDDDETFLSFLLQYKATQKEINNLGIPLRKIYDFPKEGKKGE
ncbi:MAG: ATP-binding protein [Prevotellaceae bacterium]|nr:ATP-binding protein [Prevotellaceae bacterium]